MKTKLRFRIISLRGLSVVLLLGLLTSCDSLQRMQGKVIDADTGLPLAGVYYGEEPLTDSLKQVIAHDSLQRAYRLTDSTGAFWAQHIASGITGKPHLLLWLGKAGYKSVRLEWDKHSERQDSLLVVLEPLK